MKNIAQQQTKTDDIYYDTPLYRKDKNKDDKLLILKNIDFFVIVWNTNMNKL